MALDYTKLFGDLGAIIKIVNQLQGVATGTGTPKPDLSALQAALLSELNTNGTDGALDGVNRLYEAVSDAVVGYAAQYAGLANQRLLDRTTVLNELLSTRSASLSEVLTELQRRMVDDSQSINKSVVTAGTPAADANNFGNGTVLVTKVLDGVTPPDPSMSASLNYLSLDSELVVPSESVVLTCIRDNDRNLTPEGHEVFELEGQLPPEGPFGWRSEGSGTSVDIVTDNGNEIMADRNFESFDAAGNPTSWSVQDGTAGVDFFPDFDAGKAYRGTSSLRIVGDTIWHQSLPRQLVQPNRRYRLSFRHLTDAADPATSGALTLQVYSASQPSLLVASAVVVSTAQFSTSWALGTAEFVMPPNLPDDMVFRLSGLSLDEPVWIDSMSFAPITYAGGLGYSILAGSTNFSINDRFTVANSSVEGVIQQFFRRQYGVQLPSNVSPSIADSEAT